MGGGWVPLVQMAMTGGGANSGLHDWFLGVVNVESLYRSKSTDVWEMMNPRSECFSCLRRYLPAPTQVSYVELQVIFGGIGDTMRHPTKHGTART